MVPHFDQVGSSGVPAVPATILMSAQDTFKWTKSASIGNLGLNSLIMQDDISRLSDSLRQARVGCYIFGTIFVLKICRKNT